MWRIDPDRHTSLVCPRCRRTDDGSLSIGFLEPRTDHLACGRCHGTYPVIDGVPVVLKDAGAWKAETADDAALVRIFSHCGSDPLAGRVEDLVSRLSGNILDLGCGGGGLYHRRDVIGVDWNLALARSYGPTAIVADAADPPFAPAGFDNVLLLNLLDSCANPRLVLAQADALLRPGGTLVVSCPYAWADRVPAAERFSAAELLAALGGDGEALGIRSHYQVDSVEDPVMWRLRLSARLVQEYACQLVVARKVDGVHTRGEGLREPAPPPPAPPIAEVNWDEALDWPDIVSPAWKDPKRLRRLAEDRAGGRRYLMLPGFLTREAAVAIAAEAEALPYARFDSDVVQGDKCLLHGNQLRDWRKFLLGARTRRLLGGLLGRELPDGLVINAWRMLPGDGMAVHPDGRLYWATVSLGLCDGWTAADGGAIAFGDPEGPNFVVRERWYPHLGDVSLFVPTPTTWHMVEPSARRRLTATGWWVTR